METKSTTREKNSYMHPDFTKEQSYHFSRRRSVEGPLFLEENMKSSCDLISKCNKVKKRRGSQQFQQNQKKTMMRSMFKSHLRSQFQKPQEEIFNINDHMSVRLMQNRSRLSLNEQADQKSVKIVSRQQNLIKNHIIIKPQYSEREFPLKVDDTSKQKSQVPQNSKQVKINNQKNGAKTKNLLRNFANYNHSFILHNKRAKKIIQSYILAKKESKQQFYNEQLSQIKKKFETFVREKKLQNFEQYKAQWSQSSPFHELYRLLTMKFYLEESFCYIYNSKISNKPIHIEYLNQFIDGLIYPEKFSRFKKNQYIQQ